MPNLTDTQLVILSAAAQREGGTALPLPKSLKIRGAAVTNTLDGLRKKGLLEEKPASHDAPAWREGPAGRRMMLVITEAGLRAIDGAPVDEPRKRSAPTNARAMQPRTARKTAVSKPKSGRSAPAPTRQSTKQALLIDLLKRKSGATIEEIAKVTGWQAHSVRGVISGALKKKLGLAVSSEKVDGRGRIYRIAERG